MRVSVRHIQEAVAADFGVPLDELRSPDRHRRLSRPRHYAMLLSRELTPLSLVVIGHLFDRDHSTVVVGIRRARKHLSEDRNMALKIEARGLLLQCEPQKTMDASNIGFPAIHSPANCAPLADAAALAA